MNGLHKLYVQVDIVCNYILRFGPPGTWLYKSYQHAPPSVPEICVVCAVSYSLLKACSWQSKTKRVFKYYVYFDLLLMVRMYVKHVFKEHREIYLSITTPEVNVCAHD